MKAFPGLLLALFLLIGSPVGGQEKWQGIDEGVIEKYAQERGRKAAPFFEIEGDLLLFLFALAGGIGGFIAGYFCHKVFVAGRKGPEEHR